jgi:hypothetical protein
MSTKWTSGPWSPGHMINQDHSCQCRYILGEGYFGSIAVVSKDNGLKVGDGGNDCPPEEEAIANANLIASAPELYEALALLVADVKDYEAWQRPCHAVDVALAALAKARGETS